MSSYFFCTTSGHESCVLLNIAKVPRMDPCTRRGRHSTSSSSAFDQPSSSYLNDDDAMWKDEGDLQACNTPSHIRYVNY
ncbi:hypothetical protein Tco_0880974 [Tanacetum coccineum]